MEISKEINNIFRENRKRIKWYINYYETEIKFALFQGFVLGFVAAKIIELI